jgi:RNA recognition motif-containing protein
MLVSNYKGIPMQTTNEKKPDHFKKARKKRPGMDKNKVDNRPKLRAKPGITNPSERNIGFFQKDNKEFTTIYVGNLGYLIKEDELKKMYSKFGEVNYVRLVLDPKTMKSKGIAFIQMTDNGEAVKAIKTLNGTQLDGRTLKTSIAVETVKKKGPAYALRRRPVNKKR